MLSGKMHIQNILLTSIDMDNSSLKYVALNIIVDNSFLFQSISEIYISHMYAVSDK